MRRRKAHGGVNTSSPAWMTTYGDMVTLLLTFFVMLFAMSTIDKVKFEQIINSIQGSLGITYTGNSINEDDLVSTGDQPADELEELVKNAQHPEKDIDDIEKIYQQIKAYITDNNLGDSVEITKEKPGLLIRFKENVLFDSGKADLKPHAKEILNNMALVFKDFNKYIRVEGHTDNVPIHNEDFDSNWELSGQRAANVVKYFIEKNGMDPERLMFSGYGEYHPVADNSTPEGRQKNRRVDVVILKEYITDIISTSEGDTNE